MRIAVWSSIARSFVLVREPVAQSYIKWPLLGSVPLSSCSYWRREFFFSSASFSDIISSCINIVKYRMKRAFLSLSMYVSALVCKSACKQRLEQNIAVCSYAFLLLFKAWHSELMF